MRNNTLRLAMLLTLCALVFMFALHAKTSGYNLDAPVKVTPATASKLWLSGQKMEVQVGDMNTAVLFWIAIFYSFASFLQRESRFERIVLTPPARNLSLRYIQRFLRPPPVQS